MTDLGDRLERGLREGIERFQDAKWDKDGVPLGLEVRRSGSEVTLSHNAGSPFGCVLSVFAGLLFFASVPATLTNKQFGVLAVLGMIFAGSVALSWKLLRRKVVYTLIDDAIVVRTEGLFGGSERSFYVADIDQVFIDRKESWQRQKDHRTGRSRRVKTVTVNLKLRTKSGETRVLAKGVPSLDIATYLEHAIESRLGIVDRPM